MQVIGGAPVCARSSSLLHVWFMMLSCGNGQCSSRLKCSARSHVRFSGHLDELFVMSLSTEQQASCKALGQPKAEPSPRRERLRIHGPSAQIQMHAHCNAVSCIFLAAHGPLCLSPAQL